jgi:hypothetical protein
MGAACLGIFYPRLQRERMGNAAPSMEGWVVFRRDLCHGGAYRSGKSGMNIWPLGYPEVIARTDGSGMMDGLNLDALLSMAQERAEEDAAMAYPPECPKQRAQLAERLTRKYYHEYVTPAK